MQYQQKLKVLFLAIIVSALWVTASAHQFDQYDLTFHNAIVDRDNNLQFLGASIDDSTLRLTVSDSGIVWAAHASNLHAGDAVTLWVIVVNNPSACEADMCGMGDFFNPATETSLYRGGGEVVAQNGKAHYFGSASVDTPTYMDFGPGLSNLHSAQIIFDIRGHGKAKEGILHEQLYDPNGGCDPNPPHTPCQDLQATVINLAR